MKPALPTLDTDSYLIPGEGKTPEELLMLAVFARAVKDYLAEPGPREWTSGGGYSGVSRKDQFGAEQYLFNPARENDGEFCLAAVATHYGFDVEAIRATVRRMKEEGGDLGRWIW